MRNMVYLGSDGSMRCCNNSLISIVRHVRYRECLRTCASRAGHHVLDGCREFRAGGPTGTEAAMTCATCGCHLYFHRKEQKTEFVCACLSHDPPAPPPPTTGA